MKSVKIIKTIKLTGDEGEPIKKYPLFRAGNTYELEDEVADMLLNPKPYAELVGTTKEAAAPKRSAPKAKKEEAVEEVLTDE